MSRQTYGSKFCTIMLKATSFYGDAIQYHFNISQFNTELREMKNILTD